MADTTEQARTVFSAVGVGSYINSMHAVGGAANRAGQAIQGATSILSPFTKILGVIGLGGGAMAAMHSIARMGDAAHEAKQKFAGTLQAFGMSKDFNAGMARSADVISQIRKETTFLPGPTADYVAAVQQMLPTIKGAVGGTLQSMTKLSTDSLAAFNAMGVGAGEATSAMRRALMPDKGMLSARAAGGMQLIMMMKQLKGHADITFDKFNDMSAPERTKLLMQALEKMSPTVKAMRDDFGGAEAAVTKTIKSMTKTATAPIFEAQEKVMIRLRDALVDSNGELTPLAKRIQDVGTVIATKVAHGIERFADLMGYVTNHWDVILAKAKKFSALIGGIYVMSKATPVLGALGIVGKGGALTGKTGGLAAALPTIPGLLGKGINKILGAAAIPALGAMPTYGAAIGASGAGTAAIGAGGAAATGGAAGGAAAGAGAISSITAALGPLAVVAIAFVGAIGTVQDQWNTFTAVFASMGSMLSGTFDDLVAAAVLFGEGFMNIAKPIMSFLGIALIPIFEGLLGVFRILAPVLKILMGIFSYIATQIYDYLKPAFDEIYEGIRLWVKEFDDAVNQIVKWLNMLGAQIAAANNKVKAPQVVKQFNMIADAQKNASEAGNVGTWGTTPEVFKPTPPGTGGGKMTQDFRYSRFTIEQKFAEGFDPDRIAVAFAKDVGRIGAQKLQSAFEPSFAVR
jgi:hypothetical protein